MRVPNERDDKGTIKVDVRFPDGFYFLSYQKVPGWKTKVFKRSSTTPVDLGGFSVDERFTRVVWTARKPRRTRSRRASSRTSRCPCASPTERPARSSCSARSRPTERGERVRWTGAPGSETPAPRVTLTAPEAD